MAFDRAMARYTSVFLIGCGAIGSRLAIELVKMGVQRFCLMDHDIIEPANIGVQAFTFAGIGYSKVEALQTLMNQHAAIGHPLTISANASAFNRLNCVPDAYTVIIPALDNLETRRLVWRKWESAQLHHQEMLYVDPRMGFEEFEIYTAVNSRDGRHVRSADINYEKVLYAKGEAPPERGNCGRDASPYTASTCAAMVARTVKAWAARETLWNWFYMNVATGHTMRGHELDGVERKRLRRAVGS